MKGDVTIYQTYLDRQKKPDSVKAALDRYAAENTPRANFIFAAKYIGGAWLISAAVLYGMMQVLLHNQEAIDRLGKFLGW